MAIGRRGDVLRPFQALFAAGALGGLSDGELLERSADRSGPSAEVAFAALVERHGAMVLRVCQKALGRTPDAHDAFQSTFLVLARKADAIRDKDSVASWLHGVALRVSAASRASAARRRRHERAKAMAAPRTSGLPEPDDLGGVLHEEVGRRPGRYRAAVVLCYLEGKTYEAAAAHLRLPVGTVKSRLAWARERLRCRLTRRGLAPAAGAVATLLAAEAAGASVPLPAPWVEATTEAAMRFAARGFAFAAIGSGTVPDPAAALARGVIHAMILSKLKIAAVAGGAFLVASSLGLNAQDFSSIPDRPADRSDSERLKSLETKLDRLIQVLEKTVEKGDAASITPNAGPTTATLPAPVAPAGAPIQAALALPPPTPAIAPLAGSSAPMPASTDRIAKIEGRLGRLEKRLDQLEQRLGNSARPAAPTPSAYEPARP